MFFGGKKEKARFIGKDGSCGLSHGKVYLVMVSRLTCGSDIELRLCDNMSRGMNIPYSTMRALVKNWDFNPYNERRSDDV